MESYSKEKTHTIIQPALRDIFKTKEKVEEFKKSKKGCCEMWYISKR